MKSSILQDIKITRGNISFVKICQCFFLHPSFRVLIMYRLLQKIGGGNFLFPILNAIYIRKTSKLGLALDYKTKIGYGVDFPHNFPIVINTGAIIGKCCIIQPNVLIGGDRSNGGSPLIGDYVYMGNGAKIIGRVKVGNWCFIAPGAIVTKDIPDGSTVVGINSIVNRNGKKHVMCYLSKEITKGLKDSNLENT